MPQTSAARARQPAFQNSRRTALSPQSSGRGPRHPPTGAVRLQFGPSPRRAGNPTIDPGYAAPAVMKASAAPKKAILRGRSDSRAGTRRAALQGQTGSAPFDPLNRRSSAPFPEGGSNQLQQPWFSV